MITLKPFNGIRYNRSDISELICPPYDIISESERERLASSSPDNFVNIELPYDSNFDDKYKNAKKLLNHMLKKKILVTDEPSIYIYAQEFKNNGKKYERSGIISLIKLENPERDNIFPHEKTLVAARKDRLLLLSALKANTSPLFFIADSDKNRKKMLKKIISATKPVQTAKTKNIVHKLWKISDKNKLQSLTNTFKNKRLYIADGHHRYAVAYDYSLKSETEDAKYVLGFISDSGDKNLVIFPTHRVCEIPPDISESLGNFSKITKSDFIKLKFNLPQPLQIRLNKKTLFLNLKNKNIMHKILPTQSFELRNISPSITSHLLLSKIEPSNIYYTHSESEALKKADDEKNIAVILPPIPLEALLKISRNREHMPQKSTYFYPKVFAGMVLYKFSK